MNSIRNWNNHDKLAGKHSVLSPSAISWLYYDEPQKLIDRYVSAHATEVGTILHEYAEKHIRYGIRLKKSDASDIIFYLKDHGIPNGTYDIDRILPNIIEYVNDAIGFRMEPEVILYYSDNCFGTADAISFFKNTLRIHDYKSGVSTPHIEQLRIYAALAVIEYGLDLKDINIELSIYHADGKISETSEKEEIQKVIDKIIESDFLLKEYKGEK